MKDFIYFSDNKLKRELRLKIASLLSGLSICLFPLAMFTFSQYIGGKELDVSWNALLGSMLFGISLLMLYDLRPNNKDSLIIRLIELSGEANRRKNRHKNLKL